MEERTPPSISILGQVAQCNAHEGDCAAAALGLGAFRELLSKHTNHRGRCMLMLGEAEIVFQSIQPLCHIAALRSPEPRCTGSHPDDHEIMAKRPALLDLTLELLPYEGTNDFSFNCICALSRLPMAGPNYSCVWIVSRMALPPLFSFKEMRQLNSKILQLSHT